jgi:hypothetical protein
MDKIVKSYGGSLVIVFDRDDKDIYDIKEGSIVTIKLETVDGKPIKNGKWNSKKKVWKAKKPGKGLLIYLPRQAPARNTKRKKARDPKGRTTKNQLWGPLAEQKAPNPKSDILHGLKSVASIERLKKQCQKSF